MKIAFSVGLAAMLLITGFGLIGCSNSSNSPIGVDEYIFKNNSNYTVDVTILSGPNWSPSSFTLSPNEIQSVTNPKKLLEFKYSFSNGNNVKHSNSVENGVDTITFVNK